MHTLGVGTTGAESFFGPVHNPHDRRFIAGGSCSGSAAAVATGMCYATVDTDAIGSCRLPASCCGVVGFKPTHGAIGMQGFLSHAAITARTAALMFDVLRERRDVKASDDPIRVGVATNFEAEKDIRSTFDSAIESIRGSGVTLMYAQAPLYEPRSGIDNIRRDRERIASDTFRDVDVLLLPTTVSAVPQLVSVRGKEQAFSPANTAFANYYGLPAITVPFGSDANGLPAGLQIVGRPDDELTVLAVAYALQQRWSSQGAALDFRS